MSHLETNACQGPVRSCIVCRGRFPKQELTRYVRLNGLTPDAAFILPGRGYYCCSGSACKAKFPKRAAALGRGKGEGKRDET